MIWVRRSAPDSASISPFFFIAAERLGDGGLADSHVLRDLVDGLRAISEEANHGVKPGPEVDVQFVVNSLRVAIEPFDQMPQLGAKANRKRSDDI